MEHVILEITSNKHSTMEVHNVHHGLNPWRPFKPDMLWKKAIDDHRNKTSSSTDLCLNKKL